MLLGNTHFRSDQDHCEINTGLKATQGTDVAYTTHGPTRNFSEIIFAIGVLHLAKKHNCQVTARATSEQYTAVRSIGASKKTNEHRYVKLRKSFSMATDEVVAMLEPCIG
jgi:hypothetical protein